MGIFIGVIFIIWGGLSSINPDVAIRFNRAVTERLYGAEFKPTAKTVKTQRLFGIVFLLLGFLLITGQFD